MTKEWQSEMAAATKLTQEGKVVEATSLIQRLLGRKAQAATAATQAPAGNGLIINSQIIDATASDAILVEPKQNVVPKTGLKRLFGRSKPAAVPAPPIEPLDITVTSEAVRSAKRSHSHAQFIAKSYSNTAGTRAYKLYVPAGYDGTPRPLIVMLHGCSQSSDDFAAGTNMNACAQEHGCFVAYPEQSKAANAQKCWNWFNGSDQLRDQGEPSLIAGITRDISAHYAIDQKRIYAAGLSAGGAAAAVLAETYPDIFAAVGVHSGLPCGVARDMPSAFMAMSGKALSYRDAGNTGRTLVPTIVFHGDRDNVVHPRNGAEVASRASTASQIAKLQFFTETHVVGGRSVTRALYRDARGNSIVEDWVIHGAGHVWSGGSKSGSYTDPKGPDASREMLRFFLSHKLQ